MLTQLIGPMKVFGSLQAFNLLYSMFNACTANCLVFAGVKCCERYCVMIVEISADTGITQVNLTTAGY